MKHILNFHVKTTAEGNELQWVGNTKKGSGYEVRRSTDEIEFSVIHEMELNRTESEVFSYSDSSNEPKVYYQVAYLENGEEVQVSPVQSVISNKKFNWVNLAIRIGVAVALIAIVMAMTRKLGTKKTAPPAPAYQASVPAANVETVQYKNFNTEIEALGQVISTQPIDIIAEVSGKIQKGNVVLRKATYFKKGDLLFSIDKQEAILNLKSQRSNFLNGLVMMLPDLRLDFENEYDKWNNYFQGINIDQNLPTLPTMNSDREKTFIATKNILGQFYSIKSAEERLTKYDVYAPYSGTITEVYTDAGSVANNGTRIVKVMRTDQLELELPVRKEDIQWIKTGSTVKLYSEDKRHSATGRVARISNTIDPNTQSINAYVSINPRGMKLYEGLYLSAELAGRSVNNAMEISRKAVFEDNKVFVMKADSTIEQQTIKVHKVNTETILFSGLLAGEQVVNDNLLGLADGMKIVPLEN